MMNIIKPFIDENTFIETPSLEGTWSKEDEIDDKDGLVEYEIDKLNMKVGR
jgi:hypothetical protein